ncbi:hypothetical protein [Dyadobacter sp. CY312]|uniref:hypothetical protein n=1 Tax=Dyadobacter sp. CY312 TaxID=2907303 RepID=UPI001F40FE79|nr:hypothetical protein [Dyadobacter sp. CY312]MCE7040639.1 hypothetical protein [Dyadobacter sp. CY312]
MDTVLGGIVMSETGNPVGSFPISINFSSQKLFSQSTFADTTIYSASNGSFYIRKEIKSDATITIDEDFNKNNTSWYLSDVSPLKNYAPGSNQTDIVLTVVRKP